MWQGARQITTACSTRAATVPPPRDTPPPPPLASRLWDHQRYVIFLSLFSSLYIVNHILFRPPDLPRCHDGPWPGSAPRRSRGQQWVQPRPPKQLKHQPGVRPPFLNSGVYFLLCFIHGNIFIIFSLSDPTVPRAWGDCPDPRPPHSSQCPVQVSRL